MVITVRDGNGKKDRQTVLLDRLVKILREYYRKSKIKPVFYSLEKKRFVTQV